MNSECAKQEEAWYEVEDLEKVQESDSTRVEKLDGTSTQWSSVWEDAWFEHAWSALEKLVCGWLP
jgi:hypothetical protein